MKPELKPDMKIFLTGYRCTGKTTIGKLLADQLEFDFMDTDRFIEQQTGSSILKIVQTHGWEKFRQIEKKTLLKTKNIKNTVVATGGGIIMDTENREFIKANGVCIWLDADIKTILLRLNRDDKTCDSRPALTTDDLLKETDELIRQRKPFYENTAHLRIDTSVHSPEEIVNIIDRRLKNVRQ
ncbi:shikimate kinase AroL [Desulfobacula phenolica]|uniref:Shikimate kinase n=1 Tax=Desulfobacula phenolica TaxID=90732 RepID=A0A1H2K370_9BACT|nr:shikimate kinase AroL [Desulfobacula phenolica]SDU62891.1 shikimate kinase [Desulfobacula phenolica]